MSRTGLNGLDVSSIQSSEVLPVSLEKSVTGRKFHPCHFVSLLIFGIESRTHKMYMVASSQTICVTSLESVRSVGQAK